MGFFQNFAVFLVLALVALTSAEALRCYQCSTQSSLGCLDPVKNNLDTFDCQRYPSPREQTIKSADASANVTLVCASVRVIEGKFEDYIIRGCASETVGNDTFCEFYKKEAKQRNETIEFCSTCNSDACNSSSMISTRIFLYIIPVVASFVFFK